MRGGVSGAGWELAHGWGCGARSHSPWGQVGAGGEGAGRQQGLRPALSVTAQRAAHRLSGALSALTAGFQTPRGRVFAPGPAEPSPCCCTHRWPRPKWSSAACCWPQYQPRIVTHCDVTNAPAPPNTAPLSCPGLPWPWHRPCSEARGRTELAGSPLGLIAEILICIKYCTTLGRGDSLNTNILACISDCILSIFINLCRCNFLLLLRCKCSFSKPCWSILNPNLSPLGT